MEPDLAVFAKGMANGMPLAAVVGRAEVMAAGERSLISLTYGGEALSLRRRRRAAGLPRAGRDRPPVGGGPALDGRPERGGAAAGVPFRCTGYPPMSAMHLDVPAGAVGPAWHALLAGCARRGVLLRRGGLNFVTLAHTAADVDAAVAGCAAALQRPARRRLRGRPGEHADPRRRPRAGPAGGV